MKSPNERPRIALLGSRGIPAAYGGYETFYGEIAPRLVARGWRVTVYCRRHYTPKQLTEHRGVRLINLPTLRGKYLDTPIHTLLSALDCWRRSFDAVLVVNGANAIFLPILRLRGLPVALHVDGVERKRAKWGPLGRWVYSVSESLSNLVSTELVTDANAVANYYLERHRASSTMIRYGVTPEPIEEHSIFDQLGIEPDRYFLYVSRFEPENNPHRVVEAYRSLDTDLPLVMVGDAPYARDFISRLHDSADDRVIFPGAVYGEGYRALLTRCHAHVHATEVGGTHPALVEALGYGNCTLVNDVPANREVAGDSALYFNVDEEGALLAALRQSLDPNLATRLRRAASDRASRLFNWAAICDEYERLFERLCARPHAEHSSSEPS